MVALAAVRVASVGESASAIILLMIPFIYIGSVRFLYEARPFYPYHPFFLFRNLTCPLAFVYYESILFVMIFIIFFSRYFFHVIRSNRFVFLLGTIRIRTFYCLQ